mmetsp:Transcript_46251/g.93350  ORF Transcript_46251/g.93350 Transcript_46251/m.93350 type:complete len:95 (+) Transcript_46251:123-407(+)|eukprot:CAMPEP_0171598784 /NCGR_PEP_ID=MMETSP0990-20121206/3331_1 /TAXON_ID=483369 /ORGANISM="non described non described, Strain CCMP2098" /LENGTH=94 /DNA_ID=CAMNT_0012160411 /DNA_START=118 /DNA_END=402 /DNA_ORIENTATION=+
MTLLEQDEFLTELTKMYETTRTKSSVAVTFKKNKPSVDDSEKGGVCLVRARCSTGKVACEVRQRDVQRFHSALTNIMKVHIDNLKRKERPKKLK